MSLFLKFVYTNGKKIKIGRVENLPRKFFREDIGHQNGRDPDKSMSRVLN